MMQMTRYCPTCNRSSNDVKFIGEFCEVCVADKIMKTLRDYAVDESCKSCKRIRTSEGYMPVSKNSLKDAIRHSLGTKCNISVISFDESSAAVRFSCQEEMGMVEFEKKIRIETKRTMCMDCYRRTSGYYEAVVQLRGDNGKADMIMKKLINFIEVRGAFVSRIDELSNGYNIYISDKKITASFFQLNKLKPKRSFTLYGVKRGNKVYRNAYLLRFDQS